ncbi:hypothetical protein BDM02DRAFT_3125309 [Thelephora ganbajun]|uniref:Uncharacterized protein n=1 Tax=Thelephora ganbajun TaxID=370292 RepID=A0ACB6ZWA9_THEGA|nr:hypothetical protein BDM02DRAFT_3125309 [Thelephora ganbajun]
MSLFQLPGLLWARYIEYLWDYKPGSWVDASASTFRLLAAFIIVPLALLVMLASLSLILPHDVTSYIIARTLGVIDDTKASTSDRESLHPVATVEGPVVKPPAIVVQSASVVGSMPTSPSVPSDVGQPLDEIGEKLQLEIDNSPPNRPQSSSSSSLYEGNPALAGVGVFSPAASTPSSPTIERKSGSLSKGSTVMTPLSQLDDDNGSSEKAITDGEGEEEMIKSGVGRKYSWGSMSAGLDSSYALVDRDSGSEDSGVLLRRRQKGSTMESTGS